MAIEGGITPVAGDFLCYYPSRNAATFTDESSGIAVWEPSRDGEQEKFGEKALGGGPGCHREGFEFTRVLLCAKLSVTVRPTVISVPIQRNRYCHRG